MLPALVATGVSAAPYGYQAYCLHLADHVYPSDSESAGWHHDVQGVAHDDDNWFLTQTEVLWKIPVEEDLGSVSPSDLGVIRTTVADYPGLSGYDHFGDPVVHTHGSTPYLLVPLERRDQTVEGAVAVFRCSDLSFVAHAALTEQGNVAPWCAVDRSGRVYSSAGSTTSVLQYSLDWELLDATGVAHVGFLTEIQLLSEQGEPLLLKTPQGGEFGPEDELLYLISGNSEDNEANEGIHVIDVATWTQVERSTNDHGSFSYLYNPGLLTADEPEGLTVWDLEDGRAPHILGKLHALMLNNDAPGDDNVTFYHYTNIWRVNATSTCENGTPTCPFRTVSAAAAAIFNRSEMRIRASTYPESVSLSARMRLTADGGVARIGG
jgi:hypothetical protein